MADMPTPKRQPIFDTLDNYASLLEQLDERVSELERRLERVGEVIGR